MAGLLDAESVNSGSSRRCGVTGIDLDQPDRRRLSYFVWPLRERLPPDRPPTDGIHDRYFDRGGPIEFDLFQPDADR
jgi:hypothetical protein